MAAPSIFLVALLAFIAFASAGDNFTDFEDGDIYARAVGKSGKCLFRRKGGGGKKKDLNKDEGAFVIYVDWVKQKDKDGNDVGKPVNSLAKLNFTLSPLNKNAAYQGISAANIELMTSLKDPQATLKLGVYIFKEAGNVTFGNETYEVDKGVVKFVIKVENYTFCDGTAIPSLNCRNNKVGEFLEVAIVVKSKKGEKGNEESEEDKKKRSKHGPDGKKKLFVCLKKCPRIFYFGGDEAVVANECQLDGEFTPMAPEFPKFMTQGSQQRFIYRSRKFNDSVVFDPAVSIQADEEDKDEDKDDDKSSAFAIDLNVFMFVVMLAGFFM